MKRGEIPSLTAEQMPTTPEDRSNAKVLIVSDSMLRGVDWHLKDCKVELHILPGGTTNQVRQRLGVLLMNKSPEFVVLHCGTNDIENLAFKDLRSNYDSIIKDILFHTGGTKIILSGIIHRLDKPYLNDRINAVNQYMMCTQTETVLYIDNNSTFRYLPNILNKDGLHMRNSGTRQVAGNIALSMTSQSPRPKFQAQWEGMKQQGHRHRSPSITRDQEKGPRKPILQNHGATPCTPGPRGTMEHTETARAV